MVEVSHYFMIREINKKNRKIVIFDLDGTLYEFQGGSMKESGLYRAILRNTEKYVSKKLDKDEAEAKLILENVIKEYGNSLSIGLEKEYGFDRYDYFKAVWDLNPGDFIKFNSALKEKLTRLAENFSLVLLSDAPRIWIDKVLKELKIDGFFQNIFSGEGNIRKEFNNALEAILKELKANPEDCIVFGDEEENDIIPANKLGIKTVFVSKNEKSPIADYNISNISDLDKAIDYCYAL